MFRPIVERLWSYWDQSAIRIGDRVDRQQFLEELVLHASSRWVQPNYRDIPTLKKTKS